MPPYPHVRTLTLRNFKGVANLSLELDASLTLLAGVNGVGKTSVIEALLGAVTRVWDWFAPTGKEVLFHPSGSLVRYGSAFGEITVKFEFEDNTAHDYSIPFDGSEMFELQSIEHIKFYNLVVNKSKLPLVIRYDQNRNSSLNSDPKRSKSTNNRQAALNTTLHALPDFKSWFFEKESDEAREAVKRGDLEYSDPEVRAIHEVISSIAGHSTKLMSRKPDGSMDRVLFLWKEDGFHIPFEALSGGEQAYFLLTVDLARRLLLEFPGRTLAEASGIVCIDEIELHLHPAWQREILTSLMKLFPGCQFVVTTHSPQVIGSVAARHIRLLSSSGNGDVEVNEPIASRGRDTNYVLEGIMDTPEQDPGVGALFARFDQLVDAGEYDEADQVLDELDDLIEGGSSRVSLRRAKCKRLRRAAG